MNTKNSKIKFNPFLFITLFAYFILNYASGLLKGGRWDLYQNIAMADRFLEGLGFYYSPYEASTPYFPGVAFLAVPIGKFFYPYRDYIMLFIASLIGTVLIYLLFKMASKYIKNKSFIVLVLCSIFMLGIKNYQSYMNEFKADSLVLIFGIAHMKLILNYESKSLNERIKTLLLLFVIGFMMDITKQQALYVDMAIGIYTLFNKKFSIRTKIEILTPLIIAGLIVVYIIFSIDGLKLIAIDNLAKMPWWDFKGICVIFYSTIKNSFIIFAGVVLFIYFIARKEIKINDELIFWLLISICFGIGQFFGGIKIGGNAGNFEVGVINFLPFAIYGYGFMFDNCIKEVYHKDFNRFINVGIICVVICCLSFVAIKKIKPFISKLSDEREAINYLNKNYAGQKIGYQSDIYMTVKRSKAIPYYDQYTRPQWLDDYKENGKLNEWDNYIEIQDENIPYIIRGRIFEKSK